MSRSILKDIRNYAPIKLFSVLVSILSFKLSMVVFEKEEYGTISLFVSTVTLINTFFFSWLGYVLIRYFEKYKNLGELTEFLSTFYRIGFWIFLIVNILFAVYLIAINQSNFQVKIAIFAYLPSIIIISLLPTIFQLQGEVQHYNIFGLLNGLSALVFLSLFVFAFNLRVEAYFLASVPLGIYGYIQFSKFLSKYQVKSIGFDFLILKEGLKYGLPQIGTSIGVLVLSVADRFIIEYYLGTAAVGLYSGAYRFGEMLILLPTGILSSILAPLIFRVYEGEGLDRAKYVLFKFVFYYSLAFGIISIFCSLNPAVALVLLGSNFSESINIIPYIVIGVFLFSLCQFTGLFLQIKNKPIYIAVSIFIAAIGNILLCFLLIPQFGLIGSAIATLLSYLLYFIILNFQSFKSLNWHFPIGQFVNIFVGLAIGYSCLYFIDFSFISNDFLSYIFQFVILVAVLFVYFFITQRAMLVDVIKNRLT